MCHQAITLYQVATARNEYSISGLKPAGESLSISHEFSPRPISHETNYTCLGRRYSSYQWYFAWRKYC